MTVNSLEIPRFSGIRTFMRLPQAADGQKADVSVIGVPFDTATSFRPGTRFGPAALREASLILKPYCPVVDVDILEHLTIADYGDCPTIPGYTAESLDKIQEHLFPFYKENTVPVVLGGDHSITLAELRAFHEAKGPAALLHFDAHSDTVPEYFGKPYNHGSPFYHALNEGLIIPENPYKSAYADLFTTSISWIIPKTKACGSSWATNSTTGAVMQLSPKPLRGCKEALFF